MLARAEKDQPAHDRLTTLLDAALTRDDDRALFELPPVNDADRARRDAGLADETEHHPREPA